MSICFVFVFVLMKTSPNVYNSTRLYASLLVFAAEARRLRSLVCPLMHARHVVLRYFYVSLFSSRGSAGEARFGRVAGGRKTWIYENAQKYKSTQATTKQTEKHRNKTHKTPTTEWPYIKLTTATQGVKISSRF